MQRPMGAPRPAARPKTRSPATPPRRRLDRELLRRDLATDEHEAEAVIAAGRVTVGGAVATNPARLVAPGEAVERWGDGARFVSRGGDKLDAALDRFDVEVRDLVALDAGASTGGFTDCLLQHGAARVLAVDTGTHQLHERLRDDPRVEVHEQTDVREVAASLGPVDLVVGDLSFISLRAVLGSLLAASRPGGPLLLLLKPQFEATRAEADRGGGVIRDSAIWHRVLQELDGALRAAGGSMMGVMLSPLRGAAGNVEIFVHARAAGGDPVEEIDAAAALDSELAALEG